jgi:uncharacterized membrane protein YphA (DoxX/SURF4 family)
MTNAETLPSPSRTATIAKWTLQILLALVYLAAGSAKLAGAPMMVQVFEVIGFGQWFRIVTGSVEIVGALALLTPRFAGPAALWLGTTMVCAAFAHILFLGNSPLPPLVLLGFNLVLVWVRRDQIAALVERVATR